MRGYSLCYIGEGTLEYMGIISGLLYDSNNINGLKKETLYSLWLYGVLIVFIKSYIAF